jgi:pseudouridine-5'-phosphate glycosidase
LGILIIYLPDLFLISKTNAAITTIATTAIMAYKYEFDVVLGATGGGGELLDTGSNAIVSVKLELSIVKSNVTFLNDGDEAAKV